MKNCTSWIKLSIFYSVGFFIPILVTVVVYIIVEYISKIILTNESLTSSQVSKLHWTSGENWLIDNGGNLSKRDPIPIDMLLGWSFDPLTEFWNIEIGEDGYIKTLDDRADFSERSKIVLVGGSTVAGAGATSFKKTIASNLQRLLNKKELPYKIINAGTGGWTSSNQVSYLLHKLPYEKDVKMVVFLDGYNDLMRGFVPRDFWDSHLCSKNRLLKARRLENGQIAEGFRCVASNLLHSAIFDFDRHYLGMLLRRISNNNSKMKNPDKISIFKLEKKSSNLDYSTYTNIEHFRNIKLAIAISKELGVDFKHFFQPIITFKSELTEKEFLRAKERIKKMYNSDWYNLKGKCFLTYQQDYANSYLDKFSKNKYCTDLSRLFEKENSEVFFDICHYTDLGNELIAQAIFNELLSNGFLN